MADWFFHSFHRASAPQRPNLHQSRLCGWAALRPTNNRRYRANEPRERGAILRLMQNAGLVEAKDGACNNEHRRSGSSGAARRLSSSVRRREKGKLTDKSPFGAVNQRRKNKS
jgi:hypothetical protein